MCEAAVLIRVGHTPMRPDAAASAGGQIILKAAGWEHGSGDAGSIYDL